VASAPTAVDTVPPLDSPPSQECCCCSAPPRPSPARPLASAPRRRRPDKCRTPAAVPPSALVDPLASLALPTAVLAATAAAGPALGATPPGRLLSAPVATMLLGLGLASTGLLPSAASFPYSIVMSSLAGLATPLLLLSCDLSPAARRRAGLASDDADAVRGPAALVPLAFVVASTATIAGAVAAAWCLGPAIARQLGPVSLDRGRLDGPARAAAILAALVAKNIGGGVNYVATADASGLDPAAFGLGYAADNVSGLLYFAGTFALARRWTEARGGAAACAPTAAEAPIDAAPAAPARPAWWAWPSAIVVAAALALVADVVLPPGAALAGAAVGATALASFVPGVARPLAGAGDCLGTYLLFFLYACAGGAGAGVADAALAAPALVGAAVLLGAVHVAIVMTVGRCLVDLHGCGGAGGDRLDAVLVGSNAAVGGAGTAMGLAATMGWSWMVAPVVLAGTAGTAVGTGAGLTARPLLEWIVRHGLGAC